MARTTDLDLTDRDIGGLTSADALMSFLGRLGYETNARTALTPESIGLAGESASAIKKIELLSEDSEQFLRIVFAQPRSLTSKVRTDLVRALGKSTIDHMLILSPDFETLEFVLIDKPKSERRGPASVTRRPPVPRTIVVDRRRPTPVNRRSLRRLTWTCLDALDQFAKLKSVFQAAAFTSDYFQNRNLFADYFLEHRLRDNTAWRDNPSITFSAVMDLLRDAERRWQGKGKKVVRDQLYEPMFSKLGFKAVHNRPDQSELTQPDYLLKDGNGKTLTAAFVYPWDRWLDGPDSNDGDTPEENPGACVISALDIEVADWIIVTNGKQWRLYSRHAHARATNFYEVDLVEALTASGDTDPNEAFRYWWLFFRQEAYRAVTGQGDEACWLDSILQGSRDFAKRLGENLKNRIFHHVFKDLAAGFLADRKGRLGQATEPSRQELDIVFEATLTLLYRLLFLLYAESRDLLPIREASYRAKSLKTMKDEIGEKAGISLDEVAGRVERAYSATETGLYDRLGELFKAMDKGDPVLNVPTYNGGLFNTIPDDSDKREQRIARFLKAHKIPDSRLALAIDRLSRDQDERTLGLVPIDYKSLEVRHLGSIYEGLLEFKLILANEDKTTQTEKGQERYISLSEAKVKRGRQAEVVVGKGEVYLSNDKAERKASGSYYTPDQIVEYIVANTVGPVLQEKLDALVPDFRKVRKTFDNEVQKATAYPPQGVSPKDKEAIRRFAEEKTYATHKDLVERLFDLKVIDPAMGSGHFLVEAVDFVTDRLLRFLSGFPKNPVSFALERTRNGIMESLGDQGVTVDSDKLTDINLLKRHVLKRCIYGVDLNPMAVELAKVSLWLDAFTLGAPLSFLDHHLRCGNSLVGATFAHLEGATSGRLFRLDYEPLLRAINYVLLVSKLSDTTAAEVARSVTQYDQARQSLSGYRIVLDLLVADHFGISGAKSLVSLGKGLDLTDRDRFVVSLESDRERRLITQVEAVALRPDRRFFHWEIEFPEVFFGFADASERQIKHKNRIEAGSAGFDAVVGNPPYDVLSAKEIGEQVNGVLEHIRNSPSLAPSLGRKLNLYRCFLSLAAVLLNRNGRCGMIVPLGLLGDLSAQKLRSALIHDARIQSILAFPQKDDPNNRVFQEAKLSTCIVVFGGAKAPSMRLRVFPGKDLTDPTCDVSLPLTTITKLDPVNLAIPLANERAYSILNLIYADSSVKPLHSILRCYQGEINLSTHKGIITPNSHHERLIKGVEIGRYGVRSVLRQGERQYLDAMRFRPSGERSAHYLKRRLLMQGITGVDDTRRLSATIADPPFYCGHSCNYIVDAAPYSLEAILVLINSSMFEWKFRLTSTNNNVNSYEMHSLPVPLGEVPGRRLQTNHPGELRIVEVPIQVESLKSRLTGETSWDKMLQSHAFLTAYGLLRLSIGESSDATVITADQAVDSLIWAIYGFPEMNATQLLDSSPLTGGIDGEEEDGS